MLRYLFLILQINILKYANIALKSANFSFLLQLIGLVFLIYCS